MFKKIYKNMRFVSLFTLIISAVLVFSTGYYIFNLRIEAEIREQALLLSQFVNHCLEKNGALPDDMPHFTDGKSLVILSPDGTVLYDADPSGAITKGYEKLTERPEVILADKNGRGEDEAYMSGFLGKVYSYAITLSDGSILLVSCDTLDIFSLMSEFFVVLVFMCLLIYLLTAVISKRLTENIVAPIANTSFAEIDEQRSPYEELQPFISMISYQNREIKHQVERVKRQKLRLQAVSESMNEGLVVLDRDGNILSLNRAAARVLNLASTEAVKNTSLLKLTGNDPDFAAKLSAAYENKRGSFYYTTDTHTYELFYSPVNDGTNVIGVVILMFDMTEKIKNEQIRAEFTANVSHELKTPLTSIHGYAQLITSGIAREEDKPLFAEKIEKESSRLISLVEDIIELSNLDEGIQPEKTSFAVQPMLAEILDTLSLAAEKKNVSFTLTGDDFEILAGKSQIHELLYNLLDNAVKYNKDGGKVDVSVEKSGKVRIADTGIGIPDEMRERIFERFFRVDKSHSKKVNGTGLGLSIVKHIAMNNNLSLEVASMLGEGSTFTVGFENCLVKNNRHGH